MQCELQMGVAADSGVITCTLSHLQLIARKIATRPLHSLGTNF